MEQALTKGRIVYFKNTEEKIFPAIVVNVNEEGMADLQVFGLDKITSERVVRQGEGCREWDWMPFQKYQQARLAKEEVAPEAPESIDEVVEAEKVRAEEIGEAPEGTGQAPIEEATEAEVEPIKE